MEKRKIHEEMEIPEGINVGADERMIKLDKSGDSLEKELQFDFKLEGRKVIFNSKGGKKDKKLIKSSLAHIRNMIAGLDKKYVYKLQVCSVHFPMTVTVKGEEVIIKNFLGEVKERKAKIIPGVHVKIDKEFITVEGLDKEKVGQTSANLETATRITNRDQRVFQDGIYITDKEKGKRK